MRCGTEGGQGRVAALPPRCPSGRARRLLSPGLHPHRAAFAGGDPGGGGCPWERTTREKDLQQRWSHLRWLSRMQLPSGRRERSGWAEPTSHNPPAAVLRPGEAAGGPLPNFTSIRGAFLARASVSPYCRLGRSPVPPPPRSITGVPLPSPRAPPAPTCSAEAPAALRPAAAPGGVSQRCVLSLH